jgi:hypothetical protein
MQKFWQIAALCVTTALAHAQNPSPAAQWYRAGSVSLRLAEPARDFTAAWQFDRADNGDNRVIREERRGGVVIDGAVMTVCDDAALLIKGITPERLHEMRELDEPVLQLQLLLRLLARAAPEGPAALDAGKAFNLDDAKNAIRVGRGGEARRDFEAPWQARGHLKREANGDISFDIVFGYAGGADGKRSDMTLAGIWRQDSRTSSFEDATAIADWQVYRVHRVPTTIGGNVRIEAMVGVKPLRYATLGHLRRHIERDWSSNPNVKPILACKP